MENEKIIPAAQYKKEVLDDYYTALVSRNMSLTGRREVLGGRAKFGIFGDGKELPQIAMAKVFRKGDFRSGYYRDQTFMLAKGLMKPSNMFSALYADTNIEAEPFAGGRQMVNHFSTPLVNPDGSWKDQTAQYNSASDISSTAGQMPRLTGLAQASKVYRDVPELKDNGLFSKDGREVAFGTIGNASTSEGHFWETMNAAAVMQLPMVVSVWDDGYGISVPSEYQTTKENISEAMEGFRRTPEKNGIEIITVKGWDYPALVDAYRKAEATARKESVPVLVHVTELTQPQGHSTSGSHTRYKSPERLQWESEFDCNVKMRQWITESGIATDDELKTLEDKAVKYVRDEKNAAWKAVMAPITAEMKELQGILAEIASSSAHKDDINAASGALDTIMPLFRKDGLSLARRVMRMTAAEHIPARDALKKWIDKVSAGNEQRYGTHLYSQSDKTGAQSPDVKPVYAPDAQDVDGRIILRDNFDLIFASHPEVLTFGEDTGHIGDVNQGMEGMQAKYGQTRVSDTGIREATIIGQAIGLSMRGLRPIAEIQYLDYILYGLQTMSDDLASLRFRTAGRQKAPAIIRTRGHRLEGIWHSGSPMGALVHLLRGMYVLVPRNMTKAAGFYNSLLDVDTPALVVENLNGYRKKEKMPSNLSELRTPIGVAEVVKQGADVTLVSYGSTFAVAEKAARELESLGINVELIDVQSLLPLDLTHVIGDSLKKTGRLVIADEDVPGGASAYILDNVMNSQDGYRWLDSKPLLITAKAHRTTYADDGDYYAKPNADDIAEGILAMMHESNPSKY